MKCKRSFYITPFFWRGDNWHLPLIFSGMDWCDSAGWKIPLKGLHSLSSGNNWNGWCYSNVLIWIWLTQSIVTRHFMTLTVTRTRKWRALLCNLYVGRCYFQSKVCGIFSRQNKSCFDERCLTKSARQINNDINSENSEHHTDYPVPGSRSVMTIEKASGRQVGSAASGTREKRGDLSFFPTRTR